MEDPMKIVIRIAVAIILSTIFAVVGFAQIRTNGGANKLEIRPFDFHDKYYAANGIDATFLRSRRNGVDGMSVFDQSRESIYRDVRVTATWPAYAPDGSELFWNLYAEFDKDAVIIGPAGYGAMGAAQAYPIFLFPSEDLPGSHRQSPMIRMGAGYFDKNPLGLAVAYNVVFTDLARSEKGAEIMKMLAVRNGLSSDGTPIIRTAGELDELSDLGMVEVRVRQDGTPFVAAKVMRYPNLGAITPDAYLVAIKQKDGSPLPSEARFVKKFECLKDVKNCEG